MANRWKRSFDFYLAARGNTVDAQKRALLLHCAGIDVQDVFDTLPDTGADYPTAVTALDIYFKTKRNDTYERHAFRQLYQAEGESTVQFVTRLRIQAKN